MKITLPALTIAFGAVLAGLTGFARLEPPPSDHLPVGTVLAFAGVVNVPNGTWRLCDGQSLLRADFPRLYATIGTAWGQGANPGTTFALPDLRGMFLRGAAQGTNVDPDRDSRVARFGGNTGDQVGSYQDFATALPRKPFATGPESNSHRHSASTDAQHQGGPNTFEAGDERGVSPIASVTVGDNDRSHIHTVTGGGDAETRPVNVYVNYICKVK